MCAHRMGLISSPGKRGFLCLKPFGLHRRRIPAPTRNPWGSRRAGRHGITAVKLFAARCDFRESTFRRKRQIRCVIPCLSSSREETPARCLRVNQKAFPKAVWSRSGLNFRAFNKERPQGLAKNVCEMSPISRSFQGGSQRHYSGSFSSFPVRME